MKTLKHRGSLKQKIERFIAPMVFAAVSTVVIIGCSSSSSPAQNKEKAQATGVTDEIKEKYICPNSGLSIIESEKEGALCPDGQKVLKIVGLMVDAGWSRDEILSSMDIFVMGQSIRASVDTNGKPHMGKDDAPVTMIEFTDMQCPYCKRYNDTTFPTIKQKYIDTGKLRYLQINLPLPFHKDAHKAAQALYCASDQEKFWEMRDEMFKNQGALSVDAIKGYAGRLALDAAAFSACLDGGKYENRVNDDLKAAQAAGINGTPGFVIARTINATTIVKGNKLSGAQPTDVFVQAIEKTLSK
ncbi:MAG: thioredoxin domain-containing protein [bacterium]